MAFWSSLRLSLCEPCVGFAPWLVGSPSCWPCGWSMDQLHVPQLTAEITCSEDAHSICQCPNTELLNCVLSLLEKINYDDFCKSPVFGAGLHVSLFCEQFAVRYEDQKVVFFQTGEWQQGFIKLLLFPNHFQFLYFC